MNKEDVSDIAKNISQIIEETDRKIIEKDAMVEFRQEQLENLIKEVKAMQKTEKDVAAECQSFQTQAENLKKILNCLKRNHTVNTQSVLNQNKYKRILESQIKQQKKENNRMTEELTQMYNDKETELESLNPLYQELQQKKVEFLKKDIEKRMIEVEIRENKERIAKREEIRKRIAQVECIKMANNYLTVKTMEQIKKLREEERDLFKEFYLVQEQVKLKNKQRRYHNIEQNLKIDENFFIGKQEDKKVAAPVESPKKVPATSFEELDKLFQTSNGAENNQKIKTAEPKKIQILEHKILAPPVPVRPSVPEKRKKPVIDIHDRWNKMRNSSTSRQILNSQDSDKSVSQSSSQESQQASQRSEKAKQNATLASQSIELLNTLEKMDVQSAVEQQNQNPGCANSHITTSEVRKEIIMPQIPMLLVETEGNADISFDNPVHKKMTPSSGILKGPKEQVNPSKFAEPQKSVKFAFDSAPKEKNSNMFEGFGFPKYSFGSFFKQPSGTPDAGNTQETSLLGQASANSSFLNMALSDMGQDHPTSPEFSFDESDHGAGNLLGQMPMFGKGAGGSFNFNFFKQT